jgi:alkylation response protein AidB-like acyl-CoA dehydrogenase
VSDQSEPRTIADAVDLPRIEADFGFREEHQLGRQAARRFLEERCPLGEVRRLASDAEGFDRALWADIASLGWIGLTSPERMGGHGLDHLHLALLLDEMGRCLLPSPYFACLLAQTALFASGDSEQQRRLGSAIASGSLIATFALSEPEGSSGRIGTHAEREGEGFVLRGVKNHVLFGASAGLCIVPAQEAGGIALFALELPAPHVSVEPEICVDTTRRTARITLDGVRVAASARLGGEGTAALAAVEVLGAAALASEMVGGAEAVLEKTRAYAAERIQFGRPIGSFQGVKYPIVDMMVGVELARSLALGAAVALDRDPERAPTSARMAKAFASDVYASAVRKGIQLHGGFGFTIDCDVHFYFKRALFSRALLGDATHHRRRLADTLLGRVTTG